MITQYGWECRACGDRIFSNSRHDFVSCKCDKTFVDGGFDYFRGGFDSVVGPGIPIRRKLKRYPRTLHYRRRR